MTTEELDALTDEEYATEMDRLLDAGDEAALAVERDRYRVALIDYDRKYAENRERCAESARQYEQFVAKGIDCARPVDAPLDAQDVAASQRVRARLGMAEARLARVGRQEWGSCPMRWQVEGEEGDGAS